MGDVKVGARKGLGMAGFDERKVENGEVEEARVIQADRRMMEYWMKLFRLSD